MSTAALALALALLSTPRTAGRRLRARGPVPPRALRSPQSQVRSLGPCAWAAVVVLAAVLAAATSSGVVARRGDGGRDCRGSSEKQPATPGPQRRSRRAARCAGHPGRGVARRSPPRRPHSASPLMRSMVSSPRRCGRSRRGPGWAPTSPRACAAWHTARRCPGSGSGSRSAGSSRRPMAWPSGR